MSDEKQGMTVREILAVANFRWLWLGQIVSEFGDALTHLALILLINRVTDGDTSAIAYLLIALALPRATVGLLAGVFCGSMGPQADHAGLRSRPRRAGPGLHFCGDHR